MKKKTVVWSIIGLSVLILAILVIVNIPNIRVGAMVGANDYYRLNSYFPKVEKRLNPMLKLIGKAVLGSNFNDYAVSNRAVDSLLDHYIDRLGDESAASLAGLKLANLFMASDYEQFCKTMDDYARQIQLDSSFASIAEICRVLADAPSLKVSLPGKDVAVPVSFKKTGRGETLCFDAEIGGDTTEFVFDTGAMKWNLTSDSVAKSYGMRIVCDSVRVSGVTGSAVCKVGILDRMRIGDILVENAVFVVIPDEMTVHTLSDGTLVHIGNVLGTDIMCHWKEVRIEAGNGIMTIPAGESENPLGVQNLMCTVGNYLLYLEVDGSLLKMDFDTGNVKTEMFTNYFNRHRKYIEKNGTFDKGESGGLTGVVECERYVLPLLHMSLGGRDCVLKDVAVLLGDHELQGDEYGSLGVDFIRAYDKITFNFDRMFVCAQ